MYKIFTIAVLMVLWFRPMIEVHADEHTRLEYTNTK